MTLNMTPFNGSVGPTLALKSLIHYQNCHEKRDLSIHNVNGFDVDLISKKQSPKWEMKVETIVIECKIHVIVQIIQIGLKIEKIVYRYMMTQINRVSYYATMT